MFEIVAEGQERSRKNEKEKKKGGNNPQPDKFLFKFQLFPFVKMKLSCCYFEGKEQAWFGNISGVWRKEQALKD